MKKDKTLKRNYAFQKSRKSEETLPFTRIDRLKHRYWKIKESPEQKETSNLWNKAIKNEINYEKYKIFLSTSYPKSNNSQILLHPIDGNIKELETNKLTKLKSNSMKDLKLRKINDKIQVLQLEKWLQEKKSPNEHNGNFSASFRNKINKKIKDDIRNKQYSTKNNLSPLKRNSTNAINLQTLNLNLNLNLNTNPIEISEIEREKIKDYNKNKNKNKIESKTLSLISSKTERTNQQTSKKRNNVAPVSLERSGGISLQQKFEKMCEFLIKKKQRIDLINQKLSQLKLVYQQTKEDQTKILKEFSNLEASPNTGKLYRKANTNILKYQFADKDITAIDKEQKILRLSEAEKQIPLLKSNIEELENLRVKKEGKLENLKDEIDKTKAELIEYYYKLMSDSKELLSYSSNSLANKDLIIGNGISFLIEEIWNLGSEINVYRMPNIIDQLSIKYLITTAKNSIKLRDLYKEYDSVKSNFQSSIFSHVTDEKPLVSPNSMFASIIKIKETLRKEIRKSKRQTSQDSEISRDKSATELLINQNTQKNIKELPNSLFLYRERLNSIRKNIDNVLCEMKKSKNEELNRIIKEFSKNTYKAQKPADLQQIIRIIFGESIRSNEIFRIVNSLQLNKPKESSITSYAGFYKESKQ